MKPLSLLVVATNPIQYQVPLWRLLGRDPEVDLSVVYCSRVGIDEPPEGRQSDAWKWDIPLLEGYQSSFLPTVGVPGSARSATARFPVGLRRVVRSKPGVAIVVNGYVNAAAWAAMAAAWWEERPLIMRGESHLNHPGHPARKAVRERLVRTIVKRVDGFAAIGDWSRDFWLHHGADPERIETALYCVDNEFFQARLAAEPDRAKGLRDDWTGSDEETVVLYVGRLAERKRVDDLIAAVALVTRDRPLRLVVAGMGPDEERLRRLASDLNITERVQWSGFVEQTELPFYYAAADVLALPSDSEQWGLVVNEALACGTPCIVSDRVGSGPHLIERSGAGRVFGVRNVGELAEALKEAGTKETLERWRSATAAAISEATFENMAAALKRLARLCSSPVKR